ncbi:hypothetical protein GCM10010402_42110 [Actinomadura luteofluorescens]
MVCMSVDRSDATPDTRMPLTLSRRTVRTSAATTTADRTRGRTAWSGFAGVCGGGLVVHDIAAGAVHRAKEVIPGAACPGDR